MFSTGSSLLAGFSGVTYLNRISEDLVKRETDCMAFYILFEMHKIFDTALSALTTTVFEHFSKTQIAQSRAYGFERIVFIIM